MVKFEFSGKALLKTLWPEIQNAGAKALDSFRSQHLHIEEKSAGQGPVTEADFAVDAHLRNFIENEFPDWPLISEESLPAKPLPSSQKRFWLLDPIDGTKQFIDGSSEWAIMLALIENENPIWGLIYQPTEKKGFWAAAGEGAWVTNGENFQRMQTRPESEFSESIIALSRSHPSPKIEALAKGAGILKTLRHGSVGLKFAKICEGDADFYLNFSGRCHSWDLAPGDLLLRESSGILSDLEGGRISYLARTDPQSTRFSAPFVAASQSLHAKVLTLAKQHQAQRPKPK